jgi:hypothetical protein
MLLIVGSKCSVRDPTVLPTGLVVHHTLLVPTEAAQAAVVLLGPILVVLTFGNIENMADF